MHQLYHIILIFDQLHFANTLPHPHIVRYKLMDGRTGHFVFPDLPEHTTTCGASGPNIRNLVPDSTVHILHGPSSSQPCVVVFMYGIFIIGTSHDFNFSILMDVTNLFTVPDRIQFTVRRSDMFLAGFQEVVVGDGRTGLEINKPSLFA